MLCVTEETSGDNGKGKTAMIPAAGGPLPAISWRATKHLHAFVFLEKTLGSFVPLPQTIA